MEKDVVSDLCHLIGPGGAGCANKHNPSGMSYKEHWKTEWMEICVSVDPNSEEQARNCECLADKTLQDLTREELMDYWYAGEYMDRFITPCLEEGGTWTAVNIRAEWIAKDKGRFTDRARQG